MVRCLSNACKDSKKLCCFDTAIFLPECRSGGLLHSEIVARVEKSIGALGTVLDSQLHACGHSKEDMKSGH